MEQVHASPIPMNISTKDNQTLSVIQFAKSLFGTNFKEWKEHKLNNIRPLSVFLDKTKFSLPYPNEFLYRVRTNVSYFHANYLLITLILLLYTLITAPSLVFWVLIFSGIYYYLFNYRSEPLIAFGREIPNRALQVGMVILGLLILLFSNVGVNVVWITGATAIVVLFHSLTYTPIELDTYGFSETLPSSIPEGHV